MNKKVILLILAAGCWLLPAQTFAQNKIDLSRQVKGTLPAANLPAPGASTLGGVKSIDCTGVPGHIFKIDNTGLPVCSADAGIANPFTTLGDVMYGGTGGAVTRLAGDVSNTRKFLLSLSSGGVAAAPSWASLVSGDIPNNAANTTGTASNITGVLGATSFPALTGDITTSAGALATALKNTGTAGTYYKTTFDAQGRETSGASSLVSGDIPNNAANTSGTASNITGVLGATSFPALTGDITTSAGALATALKNTGTAGTYYKATFDAQGRETSGATSLVSGDIPNNAANTTGTSSNITGIAAVANGGTGAATAAAHQWFGNNTGSSTAPLFQSITASDLPASLTGSTAVGITPWVPASIQAGADWCAKVTNADATVASGTGAVIILTTAAGTSACAAGQNITVSSRHRLYVAEPADYNVGKNGTVTNSLLLGGDGTAVEAMGNAVSGNAGGTRFILNGTSGTFIKNSNQATQSNGDVLRGFSIAGAGGANTAVGLDLTAIGHALVENVHIADNGTQILCNAQAINGGAGAGAFYDEFRNVYLQAGSAASGFIGVNARGNCNAWKFFGGNDSRMATQFQIGDPGDATNPNEWELHAREHESVDTTVWNIKRGNAIHEYAARYEGDAAVFTTANDKAVADISSDSPYCSTTAGSIKGNDLAGQVMITGNPAGCYVNAPALGDLAVGNQVPNSLAEGFLANGGASGWTSITAPGTWNGASNLQTVKETTVHCGASGQVGVGHCASNDGGTGAIKCGDIASGYALLNRGCTWGSIIPTTPLSKVTLLFYWGSPDTTNGKMRWGVRYFGPGQVLDTSGTLAPVYHPLTGTNNFPNLGSSLGWDASFNAYKIGGDLAPTAINLLQPYDAEITIPPGIYGYQVGWFTAGTISAGNNFFWLDDIASGPSASFVPVPAQISDNCPGGVCSFNSDVSATGFQIEKGSAASGHYLRGNGTKYVDSAIQAADLPNPTASTLGGIESLAAVGSKWINTISTSGVPSATQPACADLSNGAASCSTDTTNATNITTGTLGLARLGTQAVGTVLAGPSAYGAAAAAPTARALALNDIPLSVNVSNNSIITSSVDANGNPNFLAAGAGATINVNGGTTSLTAIIGGQYQVLNSNLSVTAATPGAETENFVLLKQDTANANSVAGDLVVTSCPVTVAKTKPAACGTVSGSNLQFWFDLSTNLMKSSTDGSAFSTNNAILLGVAAVSSTPLVDGVAAMPFRLNPYRIFNDFKDGSNAALSLTSGTTTHDGEFHYTAMMLSAATLNSTGTGTGSTVDSPGQLLYVQTPVLLVNNATITEVGLGRGQISKVSGACAAGTSSGYGGSGGGSGGAAATNAGCAGGNHTVLYSFGNGAGGSAGAIAGAGGAGNAATQGWVNAGSVPAFVDLAPYMSWTGAAGANGGGDGTAGDDGQGGGGGGIAAIKAPSVNIVSGSTMNCNGGAAVAAAGTAGGGGGGGGGACALVTFFSTNGTTGVTAAGGVHGNAIGGSGAGGDGGAGVTPLVILQ